MSGVVQKKVDQLFENTKDLDSLEEIKPFCDDFNSWMAKNTSYSKQSLGTVLSRCGFYKKFNSIPLEQDKNAESVPKYHKDDRTNIVGYELKHYATLLCGLNKDDWESRNTTTRVLDRLQHDHEIDPDKYLEVTTKLLKSNDNHEVAVGLIASTGRRPHEIIARASFSPIENEKYLVMFEGQGKKRDEKPLIKVVTLHSADYIIDTLDKFRQHPDNQQLISQIINESPDDHAEQNRKIDSHRNQSLNRVVRKYFSEVLPLREGDKENNCKALRAAYGALATERDCKGSVGTKMLYFARLLGHFTGENPTDRELQHTLSTLGYTDYYVTKPVPYIELKIEKEMSSTVESVVKIQEPKPVKAEKPKTVKTKKPKVLQPNKKSLVKWTVYESDSNEMKCIQDEQQLNNQQDVLRYVFNQAHESKILKNQIAKLESELAKLQQEKESLSVPVTKKEHIADETSPAKVEELIKKIVAEQLQQALNKTSSNQVQPIAVNPLTQSSTEKKQATSKPKEEVNWESKTYSELWKTKSSGATVEKIRRSFLAICEYNDTIATGDNDRIAITNLALRDLSGANGLLIRDWIAAHKDEIISHNSKYGMQNTKDSSQVVSYYNKRHGIEKINNILQLIKEKILHAESSES